MPSSYNPKTPLALALVLALVDGVETYIGVVLQGGVELALLTRFLIMHYGVLGLIADDLLTVTIATIFYLMARQGGVIGLIGLTTLNIANGLRIAVVASNAYVLIAGYTNTPLVVACGVIIGIALNTPILRLIKDSPLLTHGPGTGLKTTG
jgi:uncharacterized membrane protein